MNLQFILKTPTQNNLKSVYEDIDAYLRADVENQVFIITDDNMKFDLEMSVLRQMKAVQLNAGHTTDNKHAGMMRLQVQSFKRLAWYLLQKQDSQSVGDVSDIGNVMVIGRVLADMKDDLLVYRGEYNQIGFVEALADLFKELVNGQITSDVFLNSLSSYESSEQPLIQNQVKKMKELATIYGEYEKYLAGLTMADQNVFAQLRQAISDQDLSKTRIIITGFDYFNAQELETIVAFLENCPQVQIVLNLDQPYDFRTPDWYELFTVTGKTYNQLMQFARKQEIPFANPIVAESDNSYADGFKVLDHYLRTDNRIESGQVPQTDPAKTAVNQVMEIWEVPSTHMEADQVANEIYRLVADPNADYRYKDIQILSRDEDTYQHALQAALDANEIPYFTNFQEDMALHPLYRLMMSLYRVYQGNWRYQDVFDLLRSELLTPVDLGDLTHWNDPTFDSVEVVSDELSASKKQQIQFRDAIDLTENVVLRNGYEGQFWWSKDRIWSYILVGEDGEKIGTKRDIAIEATANQVKAFVVGALSPLFDNWKKDQTTEAAITYFYQFLTNNGIPTNLMNWRDSYLEAGQLQEARQHEQAWQTFIHMLDDYVLLFGEESFDLEYFFKILDLAFQNASYAMVPPTMDSVTIGSFDENRVEAKKITFLLGMSKYALPVVYEEKSLLTNEDRQLVVSQLDDLQALKQSADSKNNNEAYKAYLAFLSATDHLYISYPLNNGDADTEGLSPMIRRIAETFDIQTKYLRQPSDHAAEETLLKLGSGHTQVRYLLKAVAQDAHGQQSLSQIWRPVYDQVVSNQSTAGFFKWLQSSLTYHNTVLPLTPELSRSLYGDILAVSVSQLELYNRDPFSYYLKYGLKLKERPSFQLDSLQTGNYFHEMLDHFFKEVNQREFDLANLSDGEVKGILGKVTDKLNDPDVYPEYTVFKVNHRNSYLQESMKETIQLLVENMIKQRQAVDVKTIETEQRFGYTQNEDEEEETITHFTLANGQEVRLRGKIDRIDAVSQVENGLEQNFIQVVDYKSSAHDVKFDQIYVGSQLQLYTYLKVALDQLNQDGQTALPLGAFYQRIFQPQVKIEKQTDLTDKNIADQILADLKLSGYVRADYDLLEDIHSEGLEPGGKSSVYAVSRKKDGDFAKAAKVLTKDELNKLLAFVEEKIVATAEQIVSGHIALNPLDDDPYIPSMTEPYRSVSMFDATDYTNRYRPNPSMNQDEFFQALMTDAHVDENVAEEDQSDDEE
ncbi:ATP-dependent deoxyribonuclease subunit B [Carnobacterium sp. PL17GRE32]|uniref:PD-(D/E)XK nuclease family protein n=1 Tax=Carnobacterium sp. PL17GRE32 TaxID=2592355 RepID=UPI0011EEF316|nr:PD-(D/E)XK nuclease family protein [Carnobacterium sp. PL17GRE32]KAF3306441.1 ATP-dependent deoxyribonuclease subunit B [Carnobacterium sp. PL17GRE32]